MPPLLADFTLARPCKPFCEKFLTLPYRLLNELPKIRQDKRNTYSNNRKPVSPAAADREFYGL